MNKLIWLLIILITGFLVYAENKTPVEHYKLYETVGGDYNITVVEGCEYIYFNVRGTHIVHKGNCTNTYHKTK